MSSYTYLDFLALVGVGSAHPGGFGLTKQLLHAFSLNSATRVLDVGCGTGRTAAYIAKTYHSSVTAVDSHPIMIEKARRRMEREGICVNVVHGGIEHLPFADRSFDYIVSESVLAFTDIEKAVGECYRVLERGGTLAAIEMTVERPLLEEEEREIQQLYTAQPILTESQWVALLQQAGFSHSHIAGGGTAASAVPAPAEHPEWDFSPHMDTSVYNVWAEHEHIIHKYGHLLGHRVFICKK